MRTGKKITASSLLTILGVVCFASIVIATGALLSNIFALGGEDVFDDTAIVIASGTPGANDWSDASVHFVDAEYTETITVTSGGFAGSYHMEVFVTVSAVKQDIGEWGMTATHEGTAIDMTWDSGANVWYSDAATWGTAPDDWVFTFTPDAAGTGLILTFEAHAS